MPLRRLGWRRFLALAGVVLLIAACAVFMVFTLGQSLGVQALLIGVAAAILPVPVLVACFLWLDRYEPEPLKYLIFCFAWGAFVSTAASLTVNDFAADRFADWGLPSALTGVLVAPFIEELTKALGPILLLVFRRREWSGITDGLVYCGLSAVGFAMVENILYLGGFGYASGADRYGPATGIQQVIAIFILRILLFGFAHPLFTSMTGVGLGIAARTADRRIRVLAPIAGLLLAMMLHGTWNLLPTLTQATGEALIMLYGFLGLMVPVFFGMVGLALWLRAWEGRLTERTLPDYVRAGWLSPPEVAALSSLGRRHAARSWARRVGRRRRGAGDARLPVRRDPAGPAARRDAARPGPQARRPGADRRARSGSCWTRSPRTGRSSSVGTRRPRRGSGTAAATTCASRTARSAPVDAPDEPVVPIPVVLAPPRLRWATPRPVGPACARRRPGRRRHP